MDRPPGGPGATDGAFERFLTSAIATILTIIFSWRLLLEHQEGDLRAIEAPPTKPDDLEPSRTDDLEPSRVDDLDPNQPGETGPRPLESADGADAPPGGQVVAPAEPHLREYSRPDFGEYTLLDTDQTDGRLAEAGVGVLGYDTIHPYTGEMYGEAITPYRDSEEDEENSSDASSGNTVRQRTGSLTEIGTPTRSMGDLREEALTRDRYGEEEEEEEDSDEDDGIREREYMLGDPLDSSSESEYCVVFRTALEAIAEEDTDDMERSRASSRVSEYSRTRMDDFISPGGGEDDEDDSSEGLTEPISEPDGGLLTSDADLPSDSGSFDVHYDRISTQQGDPRYGPIMGTQRPLIIGPYHDRHLNYTKEREIIISGSSPPSQSVKSDQDSIVSDPGSLGTPEYGDYEGSYQASRIDTDDSSIHDEPAPKYRKADDKFLQRKNGEMELNLQLQKIEGQRSVKPDDTIKKSAQEMSTKSDAHLVAMDTTSRAGDAGRLLSQADVTQAAQNNKHQESLTFSKPSDQNAQWNGDVFQNVNVKGIGARFNSQNSAERESLIGAREDSRKSAGTWPYVTPGEEPNKKTTAANQQVTPTPHKTDQSKPVLNRGSHVHRGLTRQEELVDDKERHPYVQYISRGCLEGESSDTQTSSADNKTRSEIKYQFTIPQTPTSTAPNANISGASDGRKFINKTGGPSDYGKHVSQLSQRGEDQSPDRPVKHVLVSTSKTFIDAPLSTSEEGSAPDGFTFVRATGLDRQYKHKDIAVYRADSDGLTDHVDGRINRTELQEQPKVLSQRHVSVETPTPSPASGVRTDPGNDMSAPHPQTRAGHTVNTKQPGDMSYRPYQPSPDSNAPLRRPYTQVSRQGPAGMEQSRGVQFHPGRPPVYPRETVDMRSYEDPGPGIQRGVGSYPGLRDQEHERVYPSRQGQIEQPPYAWNNEDARPPYMHVEAPYPSEPPSSGYGYRSRTGPSVPPRPKFLGNSAQGFTRTNPHGQDNVPYYQREQGGYGQSYDPRHDIPDRRSQGSQERRHDPYIRKSWDGSQFSMQKDQPQFQMSQPSPHHRSMELHSKDRQPPPLGLMYPYMDPSLSKPVVMYDEKGNKRTCTALATSTALARKELDIMGGDYTPDEVQKSIVSAVASAEATGENPYVAVARATARAATIASANAAAGATQTPARGKDAEGPHKDVSVVISTSCTIKNDDPEKTLQDSRDVIGALNKGSSKVITPQIHSAESPKAITKQLQSRDVHEVEKTRKMTITIEQGEKEANRKEYRTVECDIPQGTQNNDLIATISEAVRGILASQPNASGGAPGSERMLNEAIDRVTRQVVRAYSGEAQEPPGFSKEGGNLADILSSIRPPDTPPKPGFEEKPNPFMDVQTPQVPYSRPSQIQHPSRENLTHKFTNSQIQPAAKFQGSYRDPGTSTLQTKISRPLERSDSERSDRERAVFYVTGSPMLKPNDQGNVEEVVLKVVTDENFQPTIEHVQLSESESEMDTPVLRRKFEGSDRQPSKPAAQSPFASTYAPSVKPIPTRQEVKEPKQQVAEIKRPVAKPIVPVIPQPPTDRPPITSGPPAKPTKPKPPRPKLAPQMREKYKNPAADETSKVQSSNTEADTSKRSSISSLDSQESSKTEATTASTDSSFALDPKTKPPKSILKSRSPLSETPQSEEDKAPLKRLTSEEYDEEIDNVIKKFGSKIKPDKGSTSPLYDSKIDFSEKKPYESVLMKKPADNVKAAPHVFHKLEDAPKETPEARRRVNTARKHFMVEDKKQPAPVKLPAPYEDLFEARRKRWNEKPSSKAPQPSASLVVVDIDINSKEPEMKGKSRSIEDIKRQLSTIRHKPPPPPPVDLEWKTLPERLTKSQEKINMSEWSRSNSFSRSDADSLYGSMRRTKSLSNVFPGQFFSDKRSYTSLLETDLDTGLHTETPLVRETDIDTLLPPKSKSLTNLDTVPGWTMYNILDDDDRRKSMEAIPTQPMSLPVGNGSSINGVLNGGLPERALSAHELRINQSLSKLSVPDWYRSNPHNPKEIIDLPNVRNRSPTRSPYASTSDVASESFTSDSSQSRPVVIMHRVSNPVKLRSPAQSTPSTPIDGSQPDFELPSAKLRQKKTTDYKPIETRNAEKVIPPTTPEKRFPAKETYLKLKSANPSWTTNTAPVFTDSSRNRSEIQIKSATFPRDQLNSRSHTFQSSPVSSKSPDVKPTVQPKPAPSSSEKDPQDKFVSMQYIQIGSQPQTPTNPSSGGPIYTSTPNTSLGYSSMGPNSFNDPSSSGRSSVADTAEQSAGHYEISTTSEQMYNNRMFKASTQSYITSYSMGKTCSDLVDNMQMNNGNNIFDDSGVDTRSESVARMMEKNENSKREIQERAELIKAEESLRYEYMRDIDTNLDGINAVDSKLEMTKNAFPILSYAGQPHQQIQRNKAAIDPEPASLHVTLTNTPHGNAGQHKSSNSVPNNDHSLDEVLGGLLAIPNSSSTTDATQAGGQMDLSQNAAKRTLEFLKQSETPKGSVTSVTFNGTNDLSDHQDSPVLGRSLNDTPEETDQLGDQVVMVKCRNMKCGKTAELREARQSYKTCHNCYTYYCSRDCRKTHWERHKKKCLFSRVNSLCKHIIKKIHDEEEILEHLTRFARTGFLAKGRGCVLMVFTSADKAEDFLKHGLNALNAALCFASVQELKESDALGEQVFEVIGMSRTYQPDIKFVIEVAIVTNVEGNMWPAPRRESVTIKKCSKLRLSSAQVKNIPSRRDEPETLILTAVPGSEFTENMEERKAREICFVNIQQRLKQKGIILRLHFPEVYSRLCAYVANNQHFTPMTIYPVDANTGKRFMCLIMPNSEPEVDWMYKPDLLEELGLSTAV